MIAVERAQLASLRRVALSRWAVLVGLATVTGIGLRIGVYQSSLGIPNSDEAVLGLMAMHVLHGQFTTFMWGQAYGGSQEALLAAPLFAVFGPSWIALRMVSFVLVGVAALVVWRVGLRTIGKHQAAVAACIYWVWPPFLLYHLGHEYGFYASGVTYCGLILLLGLRIVERPTRLRVGLFGFVFGLAFWQTPQIFPIAVPVVAWTVWHSRECLRHLWAALILAAVGATPWLVYNARHNWISLAVPADDTTYVHRLRIFVSPLIPMTIGLRAPFSQALLLPRILTWLVYLCLLGLFAVGAIRSRSRPASFLYFVVLVFPFVYALDPETRLDSEPRYLLILTPVLALLLAELATTYGRALAVLTAATVLSVLTLHRMTMPLPTPASLAPPPVAFKPLITTLNRIGLKRVYATYWIAYRLDFETREHIIASNNNFRSAAFVDGQVTPSTDLWRYPPYARTVVRASHGFVFLLGQVPSTTMVPLLEQHRYRRYAVGRFIIYAPPR